MTDNTLHQDAWLKEAERLIEEFGFACMAADRDEDITQSCAALLAHILARPASPAAQDPLSLSRVITADMHEAQPAVPVQGEPVAWRARGYGQYKTGQPGPWGYKTGAKCPEYNNPECCDIEPLYTRPAPTAAVRPADEREAFEAWAYTKDWRNFSREGSQYCIGQLNSLWHGWQARAALSVRPSKDIADDIPGSTAAGGVPPSASLKENGNG